MECRMGCAGCCIYISISSPIPGHPNGKKAGERCVHLSEDLKCELWQMPERPRVCDGFKAEPLFCGSSATEAYQILANIEGIQTNGTKGIY